MQEEQPFAGGTPGAGIHLTRPARRRPAQCGPGVTAHDDLDLGGCPPVHHNNLEIRRRWELSQQSPEGWGIPEHRRNEGHKRMQIDRLQLTYPVL